MEEKVLEIIENHNKALTYEEIMNSLDEEELKDLSKTLIQLEKNLKIRVTNKGKYEKFNEKDKKIGTLIYNPKGFGFVVVEGEDYHIDKENINGAINGDTVVIQVTDEAKKEATVLRVNERKLSDLLVGEFYVKDDKNFIKLDDNKLNIVVEISEVKGAVNGHKVIVKINSNVENTNYYKGSIVKIIGHKDDPGVDILSIAAKYSIFEDFPEEVIKQLETIPDEVLDKDLEGRRDLTNEEIFTIDGDDTKDIDDAISIKKLSDGYELGVHIADVSYYVKEGTPLFDEAFNRATSSYLADTVIPMLPHQLSNGICSLNPNEKRLAISCVMKIDNNGKTISSDIFPSVIKSNIQMTYKNVNKILEENIIPEGYEKYIDSLNTMYELSKIIRKQKIEKGYIDFEIDEAKIIVDDSGKAIDVQKRIRGAGEKLIEDFMICANEAVATTIFYMELPFIYRIHGMPSEEKIKEFLKLVNILGYKLNANIKNITPKTIQNIIKELKDKEQFPVLSTTLLRSMQKAIYDTNNIGHFGLASKCYTHFTSPIRRFPDLNVHRLIRTYLFNHKIDNETIKYFENTLPAIAKQSSERERAAIDCERDVTDMKMAEYMEDHIGEEYDGIIDTVTNYGFYVQLDNLVEGLVRCEDLDDYFTYSEELFSLFGSKSKKRYTLGDKVRVKVIGVNKDKGQIDFALGDTNGNSK